MSVAIYPTLPGLGYSAKKTPQFKTRIMQAISGKETRLADWTLPRYMYELHYDVLREHGTYQELKQLQAFWLSRQGSFDSFLFLDPDDHSVTGQGIGTSDGVKTTYQLVRSFGMTGQPLWTDVILAPQNVSAVYLNGVPQTTVGSWGFGLWESVGPGALYFLVPPPAGVVITCDFSYYFPCRFTDDTVEFDKFMDNLFECKKISFVSIK